MYKCVSLEKSKYIKIRDWCFLQDDGGGSPMEQDNGPEFSGDGGETAKVEPPKPVNYEPRQVHVSGFSLVVSLVSVYLTRTAFQ